MSAEEAPMMTLREALAWIPGARLVGDPELRNAHFAPSPSGRGPG